MNEELLNSVRTAIEQLQEIETLLSGTRLLGSNPIDYPHQFSQGNWDCEESPTGACMYTDDFDNCIFCHNPEERK